MRITFQSHHEITTLNQHRTVVKSPSPLKDKFLSPWILPKGHQLGHRPIWPSCSLGVFPKTGTISLGNIAGWSGKLIYLHIIIYIVYNINIYIFICLYLYSTLSIYFFLHSFIYVWYVCLLISKVDCGHIIGQKKGGWEVSCRSCDSCLVLINNGLVYPLLNIQKTMERSTIL
jgi:hypothetical protein